jgi:hypothetical protein
MPLLSFAAISRVIPKHIVEDVVRKAGRKEERVRALPAVLMVFYSISMCFYSSVGVVEVLRWLLEGARDFFGRDVIRVATSGGICSARARLGPKVLENLYRRLVKPIADKESKGSHYKGLLLTAIDGSTLDLQDTKENAEHFGYQSGGRGECAFPMLRFVALVEVGTHVLFNAAMAPYTTSEQALAKKAIGALRRGMLCLADRLFYSGEFWLESQHTGAELIWRVRNNISFPMHKRLKDGSYLTYIYPDRNARRRQCDGVLARVITYRLKGAQAPEEEFRLLTTLLDEKEYPAKEVAALYPQRWEIETAFDEFKTHLRGGRMLLRSKTQKLVEQEFYSFLLAHFCVKTLMYEAAIANNLDPDRLSFKHAVEVIKRKLPTSSVAFSPSEDVASVRGNSCGHSAREIATPKSALEPSRGET